MGLIRSPDKSHLRRYWFKTLGSEPEKGREALAMIGALFAVERSLVDAPPARRLAVRTETSRPLVDKFFAWCLALQATALDETPLAKALGYATTHRAAFERFLGDGRLPMHNNWSELQLRRQVVGRRYAEFRIMRRSRTVARAAPARGADVRNAQGLTRSA